LQPADPVAGIGPQRGFDSDFLTHCKAVDEHSATSYGRALRSSERVVIEDVLTDTDYAPYREANLVMNSIEAMSGMEAERRMLTITGQHDELAVIGADHGARFGQWTQAGGQRANLRIFYTTKTHRLATGLRISTSIVETNGGRLWAAPDPGPNAMFCLSLPVQTG
jgi:phosphoglycerate-specific signal transduction histidine kinase